MIFFDAKAKVKRLFLAAVNARLFAGKDARNKQAFCCGHC